MAFVVRRSAKSKLAPMSDMNVTPMIDVMLVLLVIFMVTAPLLTVGVKVNLPTANAPNISGNETPIVVHIDSEGRVFIGEVEVDVATLPAKLKAITKENSADTKIFVRGDKSLSYGKIMDVMGKISSAGFKKVVLVTELPKEAKVNVAKK
ncbi:MAG: protein TolR [Alphaproteobacteria bacterium]|nr:protein TolR [Alphaproteobacteria bacterium]